MSHLQKRSILEFTRDATNTRQRLISACEQLDNPDLQERLEHHLKSKTINESLAHHSATNPLTDHALFPIPVVIGRARFDAPITGHGVHTDYWSLISAGRDTNFMYETTIVIDNHNSLALHGATIRYDLVQGKHPNDIFGLYKIEEENPDVLTRALMLRDKRRELAKTLPGDGAHVFTAIGRYIEPTEIEVDTEGYVFEGESAVHVRRPLIISPLIKDIGKLYLKAVHEAQSTWQLCLDEQLEAYMGASSAHKEAYRATIKELENCYE